MEKTASTAQREKTTRLLKEQLRYRRQLANEMARASEHQEYDGEHGDLMDAYFDIGFTILKVLRLLRNPEKPITSYKTPTVFTVSRHLVLDQASAIRSEVLIKYVQKYLKEHGRPVVDKTRR